MKERRIMYQCMKKLGIIAVVWIRKGQEKCRLKVMKKIRGKCVCVDVRDSKIKGKKRKSD